MSEIPEADQDKNLWAVNIIGPDDLIPVASYIDAARVSNTFNAWWQQQVTVRGLHKYDPHLWARPVVYVGDAESHAASVKNPSDEYAWVFHPQSPSVEMERSA